MMWVSKHIQVLLIVFIVLLIIGSSLLWYSHSRKQFQENPSLPSEPYHTTLTGTYLCLPHTNTSGPQTLECAFGLQTDEGTYYALDFNLLPNAVQTLQTGSTITATGTVTPIERLSTDHWRKYPITGIFSVEKL